ncbi:hypothetical protein SAMN05660909_05589 [Chitinophaga terrae (ex Kim and Jung 2007)]|uniref:Uncharacterized protein n=1 Tax=Chitinophaga terrae (ex Kim and Jung 2007) TaxID=408074 RepID=A0A1H4GQ93_9BACT|nr:hypothetical protein [Chitinophaga terrae (ex Kim and Jung 2007)]GEP93650.1 hypothetical protein CTE07_52950 [Chitinophaga terrae (ex Kim and Jung 2007)]SEB11491.1 hypothetical protein SAMN05660909_05589 [Chitinophaga terrae (ex Kim and Jung 2007)]
MQQHYLLSYFEKLVRIDLKTQSQNNQQPDTKYLSAVISEATRQKEIFLQDFGRQLYSVGKKKQADWHVQSHQHLLIQLMDQAIEHLEAGDILNSTDPPPANTWRHLYRFLYLTLAEILSFIETEFPRHMDIECKIPDAYLYLVQGEFTTTMKLLQEKADEGQVDSLLVPVLHQPFEELLCAEHSRLFVSYSHLHYLTKLSKRIKKILDHSRRGQELTESIETELHFLNFNSVAYFLYWTGRTGREIELLPTSRERLSRLIYLQKKISQIHGKPGICLNRLHSSLQNQLLDWLAAEIAYHKEREIISLSGPSSSELDRWKDFKVQTRFSVPQMGAILKLLYDAGFYLNQNKTELLDFFSFFFTSVKQDTVSSQSLRSHFYKESAAVSKSIREILGELINVSHKGVSVLFYFAWNFYVFHDFLLSADGVVAL